MAKTALGRGLGNLMSDRNGTTSSTGLATPAPGPRVGRGVSHLLRVSIPADALPAEPAEETVATEASDEIRQTALGGWKWLCFAADALLLALAGVLVQRHEGPMDAVTWTLAFAAIGVGCGLALLPFFISAQPRKALR